MNPKDPVRKAQKIKQTERSSFRRKLNNYHTCRIGRADAPPPPYHPPLTAPPSLCPTIACSAPLHGRSQSRRRRRQQQSSGHSRDKNTSSADAGEAAAAAAAASAAAAAGAAAASERPMPLASSSSSSTPASSLGGGAGPVSPTPLMVDTSAAARAAAAGLGVVDDRGVRPPPVTVTGGVHRIPMDPSTAAGNKALTSSPLTPKSSMEAAALAAAASAAAVAAAAAMPPPPRREQREELGLVEQLTNMVEVFDICDLLRKVSNSNSSRLDKHGGIVKPGAPPQHLRNMSVDTDPGLPPQSPGGGGSRQGQSPTGLGSLASMELARDSGKDWDTLMAGSADVSDLGNTMVQSVAEFFSF